MTKSTTPPNNIHRRTKIVSTLGPASRAPEMVAQLIKAGVNVFRLNFSHGSHAEHSGALQTIREESAKLGIPVAVLQDLSGPKIRISDVASEDEFVEDRGTIEIKHANGQPSNKSCIYVEGLDPARIMKPGEAILLADGMMVLQAKAVSGGAVQCYVLKGGRLRSRIGIAFPDTVVDLPAATEKDIKDVAWGIENKVDYVAISFVQHAEDITRLRAEMKKLGTPIPIVAKIERKLAIQNIEEILDVSDGIMVARGDLGLELPLEKLPLLQRQLIERSNSRGLPVIVATQMLHSMVNSIRPTRAEVSDAATAVMSGADAVMLSEETAIGKFPVESVGYLNSIALEAEKVFEFDEYKIRLRDIDLLAVPDAVAYAAAAAAVKVKAAAIIACTETGTSARLVAKYRPQQPLFGVSRNDTTLRRLCLYWGVQPISCASASNHPEELDLAMKRVQEIESLPNGSRAVITGGLNVGHAGSTSVLEIREMHS